MDRDIEEYVVDCLDSGSWDEPDRWPGCVETVHCGHPLPMHELGILLIREAFKKKNCVEIFHT